MTMIEGVARAICGKYYQSSWAHSPHEFKEIVDGHWRRFAPEAKAAMEAMREVSDDMWKAGCAAVDVTDQIRLSPCDTEAVWEAMLDQAIPTEKEMKEFNK